MERSTRAIIAKAANAAGGVARFVAFICLEASYRKEELELNLLKSRFFTRILPRLVEFESEVQQEFRAEVLLILPDHQPRMSWGWQAPQAEITGLCELMLDEATRGLSDGWRMRLWSDVIAGSENSFVEAYDKAKEDPRSILLVKDYEQKSRSQRTTQRNLVIAKVAQYAAAGKMLALIFPSAIMLQVEDNASEVKDKMYQLLGPTIPIVYPFGR